MFYYFCPIITWNIFAWCVKFTIFITPTQTYDRIYPTVRQRALEYSPQTFYWWLDWVRRFYSFTYHFGSPSEKELEWKQSAQCSIMCFQKDIECQRWGSCRIFNNVMIILPGYFSGWSYFRGDKWRHGTVETNRYERANGNGECWTGGEYNKENGPSAQIQLYVSHALDDVVAMCRITWWWC